MAELFDWAFSLGVTSGPTLLQSGKIAVETYDKTSVLIAGGASDEIGILPASGTLAFLVVTASQYHIVNPDGTITPIVTYQKAAADDPITLDAPITLFGPGAAALFPTAWGTLTFSNTAADPATVVAIQILTGRTP